MLFRMLVGISDCNYPEAYLAICPCDSEEEMKNGTIYLKLKFLRFLVLLKKNAKHVLGNVYLAFLQDFTSRVTLVKHGQLPI